MSAITDTNVLSAVLRAMRLSGAVYFEVDAGSRWMLVRRG
jgi:hypothetical protein